MFAFQEVIDKKCAVRCVDRIAAYIEPTLDTDLGASFSFFSSAVNGIKVSLSAYTFAAYPFEAGPALPMAIVPPQSRAGAA